MKFLPPSHYIKCALVPIYGTNKQIKVFNCRAKCYLIKYFQFVIHFI